jgi:hypothetical protein
VKAATERRQVFGDGMVRKATRVNQGDLLADQDGVHGRKSRRAERAGVRAFIVAMKTRNGEGAKERRKVDW